MNYRGYPSDSSNIRARLEALIPLPENAKEWLAFNREEMRLPVWMLPALRAAVKQAQWRTATDPVAQITASVHRLAIEMRLTNYDPGFDPATAIDED